MMIQNIPAYLVEAVGPSPVVAWCTVCGRRTIRPKQAMMDRYGSVITDGCGDCVPSACPPANPRHTPAMPPPYPHDAPVTPVTPVTALTPVAPGSGPTPDGQADDGHADDLGPIFIATSNGVIQGWPIFIATSHGVIKGWPMKILLTLMMKALCSLRDEDRTEK